MYKMMIVDDEYYVKEGLKQTIDWNKYQIEIVGEAENGEDALNLAKTFNPDIIITDIRMPILDGVEFMKKLRENEINSHLIVISAYDDFEYARAAIKYALSKEITQRLTEKSDEFSKWLVKKALQVTSTATEQADKRSWRTLPKDINLCILSLPEGEYDIKIKFYDSYNNFVKEKMIKKVSLKNNQKTFLAVRSFI